VHAAGIVERILDIVVDQATASGAVRVTSVDLEARALVRASEAALRFHWHQLAARTLAEGDELRMVETDEATDLRPVTIDVVGGAGDAALT
jgi:Zn finger protein HypA/HybF involved in hydrogenase expression